jgi:outer membrane protein assembly factor BamB
MKVQALILPLFIAVILGSLSGYWICEYVNYRVQPRLPGQDGRPAMREAGQQSQPVEIEGTLRTFDGTPSEIAGNWPGFRGPNGNGIIETDVPLAKKWPSGGPTKLWQVQVGEGYAAPAVYDGRVYLLDYDMEARADAIRCFSLDDGREIWRYSYPVAVKRNHGMSRTVPAVNGEYIVTIGPKCHVTCLDAKTGEFKWMIDLVREYGTKVPLWYAGQCPLIVDNQAIIAPAGTDVLMMAVDCETGEAVWTCPNPRQWEMTHCSILPMRFADRDFYVYPGSRGVAGISADDGTLLWETDAWYLRTNVPTPVDAGDGRIFLSAGYNKGSMMLQLKQENEDIVPNVVFELQAEVFGADQQTPVFYEGYIYGVRADKQFVCLDTSGKIRWTSGPENTYGLGPYMIANGMIYILNDEGVLSLAEANPDGFRLLERAEVLEGHECWGPMALVGGRLLVRDFTTLVCLNVGAP